MNKADISSKFEQFEESPEVKEVMRLFTIVLAQMYEKNGLSVKNPADHILDEFEVDTTVIDKDELQREVEENRAAIPTLEAEMRTLKQQVKQMKEERMARMRTPIAEEQEDLASPLDSRSNYTQSAH